MVETESESEAKRERERGTARYLEFSKARYLETHTFLITQILSDEKINSHHSETFKLSIFLSFSHHLDSE